VSNLTGTKIASLLPSWRRSLRAQGRSPKTIKSYEEAATQYALFTGDDEAGRGSIDAYLESLLDRGLSPATVANRYRSLQQLCKWLGEEGEFDVSPMARMKPPNVPDQRTDVFREAEIRALYGACSGAGFEDRRNTAILRVLTSTGVRIGGLAGLKLHDVDLDNEVALVTLKGGGEIALPLTPKTVVALDRYLRVRRNHFGAALPWLWLGNRGRLTDSGISQMLAGLGTKAGVADVHAHRFRHTYAHEWLAAGGQEGDLMRLAGWKSRAMLARYGASAADARAREAHARIAPGENI
jgi:site-specific recombinase XerD